MRIGSNRLEIVLVGEEGVRGSGEAAAQIRRHGFDHIFLPEKAVAAAGSEVGDAEIGNSAQALDLAPQLGLCLSVQNVETELAQLFQIGSGPQLVDDGERIEFPHRGLSPEAVEGEMKVAVFDREFIVRQTEIALQPFQKGRFKDSAAAIESVAGQPDQFGPAKADVARVIQLLDEFFVRRMCLRGRRTSG